jgi:hypothetical protein
MRALVVALAGAALLVGERAPDDARVYYHYTDRHGTEVFVQHLWEVPAAYRARAQPYDATGRYPSGEFAVQRQRAAAADAAPPPPSPGAGSPETRALSLGMVAALDALFVFLAAKLTGLRLTALGALLSCAASVAVAAVVPGWAGLAVGVALFSAIAYHLADAEGVFDVLTVVLVAAVLGALFNGVVTRKAAEVAERILTFAGSGAP